MLVTVKVLGGAEHTLDVAADTPVIRVKQVLASTINESTASQRLIFKGKALADDKPLKFYNVTNGSKLNLVVKHGATPSGGTAPSTSSVSSAATAASSSTATVISTTPAAAKDPIKKGQFQVLLKQFLQQHYSPEDVTKLMEQVNKGIHDLVYNLNLDDIENTAVRNLNQQTK